MFTAFSFQRTASVARKEVLHIFRDPMTLFMTLFFPVVQLMMLGWAIDTNVRNVRTVVLDQANTQESRQLLDRFENSEVVRIIARVGSDEELHEAIVAGRAQIGIKVPEDYSRRLQAGDSAQVLVLVDGSQSTIAGEAVNVGNALALRESLGRVLGNRPLPVEVRPQVLFNPDTRTANFFVPGLLVVLSQLMAVSLSANAIVREKEKGTLEQLFMTPVRPSELIVGKMLPYLGLTFSEFCIIAFLMWSLFRVPIHGQFLTLLAMAVPFVLTMIGWGLWVSTRVSTRDATMQMAMATLMPSIFLSGYIFPVDSMPLFFRCVSQIIPTSWMIDASRGVILRGAGWRELWPHAVVLWTMALASLTGSALQFRKQLT